MSPVYYAAFVYFEKLRLKQKKPKSTHRMELEKRFPDGYWTERPGPSGARLIMAQGDGFSSTKYGEFEMHQRGSMSSGIMNGVRNK